MAWPTPQEYNEAIQHPRTAFADPELQAGEAQLTSLGLPRPITGAFASVYRLACPRQRTYAVRCFLREFGDAQERYAAISAHLAQVRLPYMVNFQYLAEGIRVNRRWYPILKMEWVEGEPLHSYVAANLARPAVLLALAEQWVQMARDLNQAGIGHGDLQHGNVLVVDGRLRLIDYDGMYVPALAGRSSHEIGHRNYQHPARTEREFGPEIDHFSTWVIYTSLVALAVDSSLWASYQGGDEALIFRSEDFQQPEASRLMRSLVDGADPRLGALAGLFGTLLVLPPEQVPAIDAQPALSVSRSRLVPAWLRDHVGAASPAAPAEAAANGPAVTEARPAAAAAQPSWLSDFLGPQQSLPAAFAGDLARGRWAVATSLLLVAAAWAAVPLLGTGLLIPVLTTMAALSGSAGYLAAVYHRDPSVMAQRAVRGDLAGVERQARRAELRMARQERSRTHMERVFDRQRQALLRRQQEAVDGEKATLARQEQKLQQGLAALQQRRTALQRSQAEEVKRLEQQHAARLAALEQQIADLRTAEAATLQQTLAQRQEQFVAAYLKRQGIEAAVITGIGPAVKQSLRKAGIVRAADLDARRLAAVPGIGEGRQAQLLEWRRRVEALARQAAPQGLSKIEETLIRGRFFQRRRKLEQAKGQEQQKLAGHIAGAQQRVAAAIQAVERQEPGLREEHRQRQEAVRKRFRERRAALQAELADLDQQAAIARAEIDGQARSMQQEMAHLGWQRARLERQLAQYDAISLRNYLQQVLWIGV